MDTLIQPYLDYPKCRIVFDGKPHGSYARITGASSVIPILIDLFGECCNHHEEVYALFLTRANDLIGVMRVGVGGVNCSVADFRIIAQGAVLSNASSIIITHNHPSGDAKPGKTDIQLTADIRKAMALLEINMLDHIVFAEGSYYSFADDTITCFTMPKPALLTDSPLEYDKTDRTSQLQ